MSYSYSPNKLLHNSLKDGASYSFMVGIGETYLAAFVLALGFGEIFSGMITVIPVLLGSIAQLLTTLFKHKLFNSKRKWVISCSITQSIALLLLGLGAYMKNPNGVIVLTLTTVYWAASLSAGPTWNAWLGSIVPNRIRIRFFAYRSQICYTLLLIGLITAGLMLHYGSENILKCFSIMFFSAGIARLISSYYLFKHPDYEQQIKPKTRQVVTNLFSKLKDKSILNLLIYLFIIQVGVYISAPYLNPFMLERLNLSYYTYMILISSSLVFRIFAYKFFGNLAKKKGPTTLLAISAIGIVPLPAMWVFSDHVGWLIMVQMLAGIFWAAHELGLFYILLNKYSGDTRSDILTFVNILNSIGMVVGFIIGGYILKFGGLTLEAYYVVLIASSVARAIPLVLLPKLMEIQIPARRISKQIFIRVIGVRPNLSIMKPIFYDTKKKNSKPSKMPEATAENERTTAS